MLLSTPADTRTCTRSAAGRVTASLLGYGVITGPIYVTVSLAQAFTRAGFDPARHAWSLLTLGHLGWIQSANLIVTGLMTIAFAAGLARSVSRTAGWLTGAFGAGAVGAGLLTPDPVAGFPRGAATGTSWHGIGHMASGGIGFLCMVAACLIVGRFFARRGARGRAVFSRTTAVLFLAAFAGIASGSHGAATTLPFTAAIVLMYAWMAAVAVHLYRRTV